MKLAYYVILIETNRHSVNIRRFTNILENFDLVFATYQGGRCKALCEDQEQWKLYREFNHDQYDSVTIIMHTSNRDHLLDMYQFVNDGGTTIVDTWNDRDFL